VLRQPARERGPAPGTEAAEALGLGDVLAPAWRLSV
jgi:hypothetical protein